MIEFEVKAPVPPGRVAELRARLGPPLAVEAHVDAYYAHPARDFARTDEALRLGLRGDRVELTYKGPRLDARTKARQEVVLPLPDAAAAHELLASLGFTRAAEVRKTRSLHRHAGFEVALDEVPGLGVYVELERQVADDAPREALEREALALLAAWGLDRTERASYLELLRARGA